MCEVFLESYDRDVLGCEIESLLHISSAVLGFGLKFDYAVDHNGINLLMILIIEDLLQDLSSKTGAIGH